MNRSIRKTAALLLAAVMLLSPVLASAYKVGEPVEWKYEFNGSTQITYPIYKGVVKIGSTYPSTLSGADDAAYLFTSEKAGYYAFYASESVSKNSDGIFVFQISEKMENDVPYGRKEGFRFNDSSYVAEFSENETEMINMRALKEGYNGGYIGVLYLGDVIDISVDTGKEYVIGKDVDCWEVSVPKATATDAGSTGSTYEGYLNGEITVSFSEGKELKSSEAYFAADRKISAGKNTIVLDLFGLNKSFEITCMDPSAEVSKIKSVDFDVSQIFIDYLGDEVFEWPVLTVTFEDGSEMVVEDSVPFQIGGKTYMFDCYIEVKSDCEGEYCYTTGEYFWYADLLYLYDEESSIPVARYENDAEEFGELSPLKNLGVMIRTVAEDISLAFGGLFTGNFEEFSFYMEWARFDFGSFFDYYF